MPFLDNKKLIFFDKNGYDANFTLEDGVYKGSFYLPTVSTFLISSLNFFIYEIFEVNGETKYGQPQDIAGVAEETIIRSTFSDKEDKRWNFYSFEERGELKVFTESPSQFNSTDNDVRTTGVTTTGIATTNAVDGEGIKVKASFATGDEGSFRNTIYIYADNQDTDTSELIAEIELYIEVEEEDERLGTLINNFYKDVEVDQQDFFIFRDVDIKEGYPDWTIINSKLKEMLLNGANLKNYQGSYRGLITAIRYFGYDALRINEYFENVDASSENFGKLRFKSVADQFDGVLDPFFNKEEEVLPNKFWKKTANFGLAYDLNKVVKGEFDEYGLPLVEDAFDFSNEEILIKLQGLKEKLKSKFLPLSARIISVTGEGNYFSKYDINTWSDANERDVVDVGKRATLDVNPEPQGFIISLNKLLIEIDSIVRQDTDLVVPTVQENTYNTALNNEIPLQNIAVEVENVTVNGNDFFVKGVDYILSGAKDSIIWTSNTFTLQQSDAIVITYTYSALDIPLETWNPNPTTPYNKLKEDIIDQSIILDSKYTQTFLESIINKVDDSYLLTDDEDTPVGCPLTLTNTTFKIEWDEMAIQWNEANEGVNGTLTTWDKIKYENFYEIEWTIVKRVDNDSPQEWTYNLRGNVQQYESINLILPYKGTYDIDMRLYNTFNSSTSENYVLEVEQKNPEIVANHKAFRTDYTWEDFDRDWENTWFTWAVNLTGDLNWEDADTTWNSIDKANYSNARFYNDLYNYTLNDIENALWNELDHLWWEGTNDAIFYNPYNWKDIGLKTWNQFYQNETWDGVKLSSDSPAFFEIYSVEDIGAKMTIGKRIPRTYEVTTQVPGVGPVTEIFDYKYKFIRTNPLDHPEGNLLAIKDTPGNTLLTISRDANRYITALNGIDFTTKRGFFIEFTKEYDGSNILIGEPAINDEIKIILNGTELIENTDYTIIAGDPQTINWITSIVNGDSVEVSYYSLEEKVLELDNTTNFINLGNNTLEINDSLFFNNLIENGTINLKIPSGSNTVTISRQIETINSLNNTITYSGANRSTINEIQNPLNFDFVYNVATYPPLKESALRNIIQALSEYNADLYSSETLRNVFDVKGDTIEFSNSAVDLEIAYQELLSSDLPNFKRFNWNILYEEDEITVNRIQATSNIFSESQESYIKYENILGDEYAPAITLNYNWSELRIFETRKELPQFCQVIFSYDNSTMAGKQLTGNWELTEVESGSTYTLTENIFSHFFNRRGEYILKLDLSDSNGNFKETIKQGFVVIE